MLIFILRSDDTYCVCEGQIMPCKLKSYFQGVTRINLIWMTYSKKKKKTLNWMSCFYWFGLIIFLKLYVFSYKKIKLYLGIKLWVVIMH